MPLNLSPSTAFLFCCLACLLTMVVVSVVTPSIKDLAGDAGYLVINVAACVFRSLPAWLG